VFGNSDAGVAYLEHDACGVRGLSRGDTNLTGICELDRVRDKIRQNLLQFLFVRNDKLWQRRIEILFQAYAFFFCRDAHHRSQLGEQAVHVYRRVVSLYAVGLDAAEVKNVVQQVKQTIAALFYDGNCVTIIPVPGFRRG
jgi:hypothetical protein